MVGRLPSARRQTAEAAVWQKLNSVLNTYYPTASGAALPIVKFAIDSGYATPEVYAWTRKYGGARAVVIKGDSRAASPLRSMLVRGVIACAGESGYGR